MSGAPLPRLVAYMGAVVDGHSERVGATHALTDWQGNRIGFAKVTAGWPTPRSHVSSRMLQVRATVGGVTYTGRTAGEAMAVSLRHTPART